VKTISQGPSVSDLRERVETAYDSLTGKKSLERRLAFENGSWVEKTRESYSYDALAQLQRVTHADNTFVAYTYDQEGRVVTVRDENHAVANTVFGYDPAGSRA
jgi:YD repeat-containing protein